MNKPLFILLTTAMIMVFSAVDADVTGSGENGFSIHHVIALDARPEAAYLSIDARAGGCFCEKLADGGSMQHMLITWAQPGKELRMTGGLGPLQMMGVHGGMQWRLKPADEGSVLEYNYVVTGFSPDGLAALAPIVDTVQGQQLEALRSYLAQPED